MISFDKAYYYLAKFYKKPNKEASSWESQSILALSSTQFIIVLDIFMVIDGIFFNENKLKINNGISIMLALIAIIIFFFNYRRYSGKFEYLNDKFGHKEKKVHSVNNLILIISIIFIWFFIFIAAIVFNRF